MKGYSSGGGVSKTVLEILPSGIEREIVLPVHGFHSALNAAAVVALCDMLGIATGKLLDKVPSFKGVWRRFDFAGENSKGAQIYDDYAHGSSSFSPTSEETVELFMNRGTKKYFYFCSKEAAEKKLKDLSGPGDMILIMGARDNSLSLWAKKISS